MENFFPSRGCVYQVTIPGGATQGFYHMEGLTTGSSGAGGSSSVVLLQGVDLTLNDIVQPVVTLENLKVLYTFGTDYGNVAVYGEILMGPDGSTASNGFNSIVDFYKTNRISKSKTPVTLSLPGSKAYSIYLQGLQIGRIDPEYHVQPFVFIGLIADT